MPTPMITVAKEKSTYIVTCAFYDEEGDSVVPTAITWSLRDAVGNVINSRSSVSVTVAASIDIVLSGNDLAIQAEETGQTHVDRRLTVEATYNSDAGSGLPLKAEAAFSIENFVGVS